MLLTTTMMIMTLIMMTMMITMVAKWSSYAAPTASGLSWLTLAHLPLAPLAEDKDEDEGENIMMRMRVRMIFSSAGLPFRSV